MTRTVYGAASQTDSLPPHTFHPIHASGMAATTAAANRQSFMRVIGGSGTITKIGMSIGVSSGNVTASVYANNGQQGLAAAPGARLATSGSVPCPTASTSALIPLTSPATVTAGMWFAFSVDNAIATFVRNNGNNTFFASAWSRFVDATFLPPDVAPATAGTGSVWLMVGVS